ncbi:SH3 domain-containing protein [Marinimicrobium locisalis]|uniref:SH3 domain-containing protein n=1 Tax=Marinimicrobium locisalis TaxID=546022 RepID=UPI0032214502
MRRWFFGVTLALIAAAPLGAVADEEGKASYLQLEVIDPYVDVRSGPGRGYPIFYVIEQGEKVDVLTRRPGWYEVRMASGRTGWSSASQISRTLQTTGEPADLPSVSYGDYLASHWRVGFNSGQFSSGELQSSDTFSFLVGYRPLSWMGLEAEVGKVLGAEIKGELYSVNVLIEPFSDWRVSPLLMVGRGNLSIDSQPKLVPLEIGDEDFNQYGLGLNYYIGRNFVLRGEYRWSEVDTDDNSESLEVWKIGFSTFF